jgi:peptide/nickel transport system substrate-binding protein
VGAAAQRPELAELIRAVHAQHGADRRGDSRTLPTKTSAVHPGLPMDLASVLIVPAGTGIGATTQDCNSGKAAVGTGSYKLVEWVNG